MVATKMSTQRKSKLQALAKLMNRQSEITFPINRPLLDCFDLAINPEQTDFLLKMGTEPRTYEQVAAISGMAQGEFKEFFDTLLKKGLVWPQIHKPGEERYTLPAILLGWFELQLCKGEETPEEKEFAKAVDRLFQSWRDLNIFPLRPIQNLLMRRTSPFQSIAAITQPSATGKKRRLEVNQAVEDTESKIYPTQSVHELIEQYGSENAIALIHCFCRQWRKMANESCRLDVPSESCLVLGDFTEYIVKYGFGRYATKQEALEKVKEAQKAGVVHTVFHERDDTKLPRAAICNCCWDCCGVFGSYNRGIFPLHFKCYFIARIPDVSLCTGCGTCEKHCPVNAISIVDKISVIQEKKCIGCGQCAFQCPEGAVMLDPCERSVMLPLQKKSEVRIPS